MSGDASDSGGLSHRPNWSGDRQPRGSRDPVMTTLPRGILPSTHPAARSSSNADPVCGLRRPYRPRPSTHMRDTPHRGRRCGSAGLSGAALLHTSRTRIPPARPVAVDGVQDGRATHARERRVSGRRPPPPGAPACRLLLTTSCMVSGGRSLTRVRAGSVRAWSLPRDCFLRFCGRPSLSTGAGGTAPTAFTPDWGTTAGLLQARVDNWQGTGRLRADIATRIEPARSRRVRRSLARYPVSRSPTPPPADLERLVPWSDPQCSGGCAGEAC